MEDKYVGQNIGIYHVLEKTSQKTKYGHILYLCECNVCHQVHLLKKSDIFRATTCHHSFNSWGDKSLGVIYRGMRRRCENSSNKDYKWYGAKNISICQEWKKDPSLFESWALSNGYTKGLTIDRIDSSKGYEPSNCRWLTREENSRRAGKVNWIKIGNKTLTGRQWARQINVGVNRINNLVRKKGVDATTIFIKERLQTIKETI